MISIIGAGGHAKVVQEALRLLGFPSQMYDRNDIPGLANPVIGVGDIEKRKALFKLFKPRMNVIHPYAVVAPGAVGMMCAVQIMAGAVVQPGASIGANTLVNTRASVDHDCRIGAHCHIAPGATLCGTVTLGERCFIGAGATIVQGVTLDAGTFVPAGALVVGPDDMRRPQRVVSDREYEAAVGAIQRAAGLAVANQHFDPDA